MSLKRAWEARCLPGLIDKVCRSSAILEERRRWVPRATGTVLELGVGSGLNLGIYDPIRVTRLVGIDPSEPLLARSRERARALPFAVELRRASAEALPVDAASIDTVVATYTLCSVASSAAALGEARRVLRRGGRLIFIEHGAAPDAGPRRWQERITPLWRHVSGNCHLDRDVRADLRAAGFTLGEVVAAYAEGPRWMSFTTAGTATV